jgi:hypothetical protein
MCILTFSTILSQTFLVLRRTERDIVTKLHASLCKVPLILVRIYQELNFLDRSSKKSSKFFMKSRLVGTELFYADRKTDRYDEINNSFSQFSQVPKNRK